jgi:hypothetical protein
MFRFGASHEVLQHLDTAIPPLPTSDQVAQGAQSSNSPQPRLRSTGSERARSQLPRPREGPTPRTVPTRYSSRPKGARIVASDMQLPEKGCATNADQWQPHVETPHSWSLGRNCATSLSSYAEATLARLSWANSTRQDQQFGHGLGTEQVTTNDPSQRLLARWLGSF